MAEAIALPGVCLYLFFKFYNDQSVSTTTLCLIERVIRTLNQCFDPSVSLKADGATDAGCNLDLYTIIINYKRITVRYWTHTVSGVTLADVQMAQKIDPLFG